MEQPQKVAPQKPNCVRTALQTQIDKLKENEVQIRVERKKPHQGMMYEAGPSGNVRLEDAIQALEDLEVALTDCYKSQ